MIVLGDMIASTISHRENFIIKPCEEKRLHRHARRYLEQVEPGSAHRGQFDLKDSDRAWHKLADKCVTTGAIEGHNLVAARQGHDGLAMLLMEFKSCVVARGEDDKLVIAHFDGGSPPATIAILRCTRETALALKRNLSFALSTKSN